MGTSLVRRIESIEQRLNGNSMITPQGAAAAASAVEHGVIPPELEQQAARDMSRPDFWKRVAKMLLEHDEQDAAEAGELKELLG